MLEFEVDLEPSRGKTPVIYVSLLYTDRGRIGAGEILRREDGSCYFTSERFGKMEMGKRADVSTVKGRIKGFVNYRLKQS